MPTATPPGTSNDNAPRPGTALKQVLPCKVTGSGKAGGGGV